MAYVSPRLNAQGEKIRDRNRAATSARSNTGSAGDAELFVSLRKLFLPHASQLVVTRDLPGDYSLDTRTQAPNGKPLFFGGVRAGRSHTSFYLMPIHTDPDLLVISEHLRKRLQGKSCFAFKTVEPALLDELSTLTARCFESWSAAGKIGSK